MPAIKIYPLSHEAFDQFFLKKSHSESDEILTALFGENGVKVIRAHPNEQYEVIFSGEFSMKIEPLKDKDILKKHRLQAIPCSKKEIQDIKHLHKCFGLVMQSNLVEDLFSIEPNSEPIWLLDQLSNILIALNNQYSVRVDSILALQKFNDLLEKLLTHLKQISPTSLEKFRKHLTTHDMENFLYASLTVCKDKSIVEHSFHFQKNILIQKTLRLIFFNLIMHLNIPQSLMLASRNSQLKYLQVKEIHANVSAEWAPCRNEDSYRLLNKLAYYYLYHILILSQAFLKNHNHFDISQSTVDQFAQQLEELFYLKNAELNQQLSALSIEFTQLAIQNKILLTINGINQNGFFIQHFFQIAILTQSKELMKNCLTILQISINRKEIILFPMRFKSFFFIENQRKAIQSYGFDSKTPLKYDEGTEVLKKTIDLFIDYIEDTDIDCFNLLQGCLSEIPVDWESVIVQHFDRIKTPLVYMLIQINALFLYQESKIFNSCIDEVIKKLKFDTKLPQIFNLILICLRSFHQSDSPNDLIKISANSFLGYFHCNRKELYNLMGGLEHYTLYASLYYFILIHSSEKEFLHLKENTTFQNDLIKQYLSNWESVFIYFLLTQNILKKDLDHTEDLLEMLSMTLSRKMKFYRKEVTDAITLLLNLKMPEGLIAQINLKTPFFMITKLSSDNIKDTQFNIIALIKEYPISDEEKNLFICGIKAILSNFYYAACTEYVLKDKALLSKEAIEHCHLLLELICETQFNEYVIIKNYLLQYVSLRLSEDTSESLELISIAFYYLLMNHHLKSRVTVFFHEIKRLFIK